jgi:hypothetical protein
MATQSITDVLNSDELAAHAEVALNLARSRPEHRQALLYAAWRLACRAADLAEVEAQRES